MKEETTKINQIKTTASKTEAEQTSMENEVNYDFSGQKESDKGSLNSCMVRQRLWKIGWDTQGDKTLWRQGETRTGYTDWLSTRGRCGIGGKSGNREAIQADDPKKKQVT